MSVPKLPPLDVTSEVIAIQLSVKGELYHFRLVQHLFWQGLCSCSALLVCLWVDPAKVGSAHMDVRICLD